jgi:hypothetical protein
MKISLTLISGLATTLVQTARTSQHLTSDTARVGVDYKFH